LVALESSVVIPLRDVVPTRTRPGVTLSLIALHAAVFIWQAMSTDRPLPQVGDDTVATSVVAWLHVLAGLFSHAGGSSLIGNMLALWLFGENVEDRLGHARFLVLYVTCGAVAGVTHAWLAAGHGPGPGAAGAVAGVVGAYVWQFPRSRILVLIWPGHTTETPALVFLAVWLALVLAGGHASWGLITGLVAGMAVGWLAARPERTRIEWYEDR
jgi:membrane associated rhomboid family serine protease